MYTFWHVFTCVCACNRCVHMYLSVVSVRMRSVAVICVVLVCFQLRAVCAVSSCALPVLVFDAAVLRCARVSVM